MRQGIKRIFEECTNKEARNITQIFEGFSNENFLINDAYVLRLPLPNGDPTISRKCEEEVYKVIQPLNISEKVEYFNPKNGIKITKYVHNPMKYQSTPTKEEILNVVKTLKKLHKSQIKVPFEYNAVKKLQLYKKTITNDYYLDQKYEKMIIKEYQKLQNKEDEVLCHNDLVKGNLLFKFNGLTIIDWEYASMNSFYFDLASFISENNLSDEQETFFLSKYFGYKYTNRKRKIVNSFIKFLDILFYYWGLYLYKKRGDQVYYSISLDKFNRIKNSMMEIKDVYLSDSL